MIFILEAVITIFLIINCASRIAFRYMTLGKRRSLEECFGLNESEGLGRRQEFNALKQEEVEVKTIDGLILRGRYIERFKESKRIVIVVHGYNLAHPRSYQFIHMFFKKGFNVLLIDQRGHGRSEGKFATYGYFEKYDLQQWISWVIKKLGEDAIIGLHGQSMGGATVLEYAALNKHAKFIIADCPYSDAWQLIKHQFATLHHVPIFPFAFAADLRLKRKAGFSLKHVSPIKAISNEDIPVMFIHGSKDNFVPTSMSEDMFRVKQGSKKLLIVEGAQHANAYVVNKELYEKEVFSFIDEVLG